MLTPYSLQSVLNDAISGSVFPLSQLDIVRVEVLTTSAALLCVIPAFTRAAFNVICKCSPPLSVYRLPLSAHGGDPVRTPEGVSALCNNIDLIRFICAGIVDVEFFRRKSFFDSARLVLTFAPLV